MTGSRTTDIPLRNLEMDAAHFHDPVRNYHLPSSARKQYACLACLAYLAFLHPLARYGNAPVST